MTGYVHVYTGEGKGKTTAALGLAFRAAGHGFRTFFGQFLKNFPYGEFKSARMLNDLITIRQFGGPGHISFAEGPGESDIELAAAGFAEMKKATLSGDYRIIVLDEFNIVLFLNMIPWEDVRDFIDDKPQETELIFTGRHAPEALVERADLVSEIREVKHYFQQGVTSRAGIDK